jgi:hypothetical protein
LNIKISTTSSSIFPGEYYRKTYFYDVNGNRDYIDYQGGLKVEYVYDKNNRLKKLLNKNSAGNTVSSYEYSYDLTGRQ